MVGESGVRQLVMVVVVVLMMASANAAFIDKRPKMPRYPISSYYHMIRIFCDDHLVGGGNPIYGETYFGHY